MSIFNFTNPPSQCQKGFLLLEAMVTLAAVCALIAGIASWYVSSVQMQRTIHARAQAMALATSLIASYQVSGKLPSAMNFSQEGLMVKIKARHDHFQKTFYWFTVTICDERSVTLVEYLAGMKEQRV